MDAPFVLSTALSLGVRFPLGLPLSCTTAIRFSYSFDALVVEFCCDASSCLLTLKEMPDPFGLSIDDGGG